jgi:hypothetical protein
LLAQFALSACWRTLLSVGSRIDRSTAMMPITTSSSINVKACVRRMRLDPVLPRTTRNDGAERRGVCEMMAASRTSWRRSVTVPRYQPIFNELLKLL